MSTKQSKGLLRSFFLLFLPLALFIGLVGTLMSLQSTRSDSTTYILNEQHNLEIVSHNLLQDLGQIISDIRLMEQSPIINRYINTPSRSNLEAMKKGLMGLSRTRSIYSQIRLLDNSGMEICNISQEEGVALSISPAGQEQAEEERYFFSEIKTLVQGEVHVSSLELDMRQPTIRFATPLFTQQGEKKGTITLHYRASTLLEHIRQVLSKSAGETLLLNNAGYYMLAPNPEDEWGFARGRENSFASSHPGVWQYMQSHDQGQLLDQDDFYIFVALYPRWYANNLLRGVSHIEEIGKPPAGLDSQRWLVVSRLPAAKRSLIFYRHAQLIILLTVILLTIVASGSLLYVRNRHSRLAEERKMAAITSSAHDAIIMLDDQDIITFWNPAATKIFGFGPEDAVGMELSSLIVPKRYRKRYKNFFRQFILQAASPYEGRSIEAIGQRNSGEEISVEFSLAAVNINDERQAVALIRDITGKKKTLNALAVAKQRAEQANRAKSDFVANMSHEIRTPMNAIIGLSELALGLDMESRLHDYFLKINRSGHSLLKILNDVLDYSKIEAGKLTITPRGFYFYDLLQGLATLFAGSAEEKDIELLFETDPSVPLRLRGDDLRLHQVLVNLIGNSFKFTQHGEIRVAVSMVSSQDKEVILKFAVTDCGIGIPKDKLATLFEPFTQVDSSTTRKYGGTGLGLNICQQLVEMMGGKIEVESEPGHGSTFYFAIPLEAAGDSQERMQIQGQPSVLLVVEHHRLCQALVKMLENFGCRVAACHSGQQALEIINTTGETSYDLAIVDYFLSGMDGPDTCNALRDSKKGQEMRIIMLTGLDQQKVRKRSSLVVDGFISRPVAPSALFNTLAEFLRHKMPVGLQSPEDDAAVHDAMAKIAGATILLAEDSEVNRQVALEMLERVEIKVETAGTGLEALAKSQEQQFDAIIMDIQMPELDGYSTAQAIRERKDGHQQVPIIAMTAHAFADNRRKCQEAGMDDFISKPVQSSELYLTLAKWVKGDGRALTFKSNGAPSQTTGLPGQIAGIDLSELLERVGHKHEFLVRLLRIFRRNYGGFIQEVDANLKRQDLDTVRDQAHTVKGVAATLCAWDLQEAALALEKAAEEGLEPKEEMATFSAALRQVLNSIDRLVGQMATDTEDS